MVPKAVWYAAPIVVLGAAGAYYWYFVKNKPAPPAPVETVQLPPPAEPAEPEIKNPVPEDAAPAEKPLPSLNDSDSTMHDALVELADAVNVDKYVVTENLVRNIVVTVDNLPRSKVTLERRPIKPTPGVFESGEAGQMLLGEANYARYEPFIKLVQTTDAKQLSSLYLHYYPLFQEAYESLGNPDTYFNDRLVEVIDHLLETPMLTDPVPLAQPKVFYEYADPQLEARSAGQKLLLRMGPANAGKLKAKLREFRAEITKNAKKKAGG